MAIFSKIVIAYNNVYRKLLGLCRSSSASEMFVMNNISNYTALIRKSIFALTFDFEHQQDLLYGLP